MRATSSKWSGAVPVWLLTIEWSGKTFTASSEPISVPTQAGGSVSFHGGLVSDPDFNFEMPDLGFQVSSYSTPIALYLNGVDFVDQAKKHNHFDNAYCRLDYVLVKNGTIANYEDRIELIHGFAKQPVYGHFDKPKSYIEFSLENPIIDSSAYALAVGKNAQIASKELSATINTALSPLSSIFISGTTFIEVIETHKGKNIPFVFGEAGQFYDDQNTLQSFGATPAYVIYATSGSTNKIWLAIAAHDVDATRVRIYDDKGNNRVESVQKFIGRGGDVFCFVEFTHASGGFQNPVDDESARFYCSWSSLYGGGYRSPTTNKPITTAGDLCLFMLSLGNQEVDYAAWYSIKTLLDSYKFSGYINQLEVSPLQFLENEIVPFLPISIIQSNTGLKPVYNVLATGSELLAIAHIDASPEFALNGAIITSTDTSNLINDYSLEYVYDPHQNEHKKTMRITGNTKDLYENVFSNQLSVHSYQKFGTRPQIDKSNFIHDESTASRVCSDKITFHAIPQRTVQYVVAPRYGFIDVGDIIVLTDPEVGFERMTLQVIMKSWEDTNWLYTFKVAPKGDQL